MAPKRWTLVVTELGASTVLHSVEVDATNWMSALSEGRARIGETGGVPAGASCAVAPDGRVTILDPVAQRSYAIAPKSGGSLLPSRSAPPAGAPEATTTSAAAPNNASAVTRPSVKSVPPPASPTALEASVGARSAGLGYIATPLASRSASDIATTGTTPSSVRPAALASAPMTSSSAGATPAALPSAATPTSATPSSVGDITVVDPPRPGSTHDADVRPPMPEEEISTEWQLLSHREENPSQDSPITFRERTYVVPGDMPGATVEVILRRRLAEVQATLAHLSRGRFVMLAAFDHAWTEAPERPPVAVLEWKDWRGGPVIRFPLAEAFPFAQEKRRATPTPPPPAARPPIELTKPSVTSAGEDARIAQAFEATQDLFMLRSPAEGMEFVAQLLEELVPAEAITGALYDIDRDEFRFVALRGIAAADRKGEAVSARAGLFGAAVERRSTLVIGDLMGDDRFDDAHESRPGLVPRDAIYVPLEKSSRLLGMLQILNRRGRGAGADGDGARGAFSDVDVEVATYLGRQLSEFLLSARASIVAPGR